MSVTNEKYKNSYPGLGTTGPYPITFPVTLDDGGNAKDILIVLQDAAGAETEITGACTISGLNVYTGTAYDSTYKVVILRYPTLTQPYTFEYVTKFPSKSFESALDRLTFLIQRLALDKDLSLKAALSDDEMERLPSAPERANSFLAFDEDGNPIAAAGTSSVPVSTWAETLLDDETLGEAQATLGQSDLGIELVGDETESEMQNTIAPFEETTADKTLSIPGRYIINNSGGLITLPGIIDNVAPWDG